jgi:hypothetical protein
MNYGMGCCGNAALTKAMRILTDVNTKLLKTVTVNVLESK